MLNITLSQYKVMLGVTGGLHIALSGIIGSGKTTLATELGRILGLPVHFEPIIDNEYLVDFYNDMKTHAFAFEVYLLNARFVQHHQLVWSSKGGIQDRTIYEDLVFAQLLADKGMISQRDHKTYTSLFSNMLRMIDRPNLIIHLDVSPEESLRRIRMRGRECEIGITEEYINELHSRYETFIGQISATTRVIRIPYDKFIEPEHVAQLVTETCGNLKLC